MTPEEIAYKVYSAVHALRDAEAHDIIRQAIADEREACAKVAEEECNDPKLELTSIGLARNEACSDIAASIRARGKE